MRQALLSPMESDAARALAAAYKLERARILDLVDQGEIKLLTLMETRPGEQQANLARFAPELEARIIAEVSAGVDTLIAAHLATGDRDPAWIVAHIRAGFLAKALQLLPGAAAYVSMRGSAQTGLWMRNAAHARFAVQRDNLSRSVHPRAVIRARAASTALQYRLEQLKRSWVVVLCAALIALAGAIAGLIRSLS